MKTQFQSLFAKSGVLLLFISATQLSAQERGMSRNDVIDALEQGVNALKTIDKPDDAERLRHILEQYLNPRHVRKNDNDDREGVKRELTEREIGKEHVKHMRFALEGLIDAEKRDAAHLLERGIHARELRLEGADSPEAREVIRTAPSRVNEIELLLYAANLLEESGKTEKAAVVRELGEKFQATHRRNVEREQAMRHQRDSKAGERGEQFSIERLMSQTKQHQQAIRQLSQQLENLANSQERLQRHLKRISERD